MAETLDDLQHIKRLDAAHMAAQLKSFLDDLESGARSVVSTSAHPKTICLSGIGGSAMAGDVLYDILSVSSNIPITVNRSVTLPRWVGKDGLSIITSYSGNTQEALEVLDDSSRRGCHVVCITSGGKLAVRAKKRGHEVVPVPSGIQPRAALGHLLGAAAAVLQKNGAGEPVKELLAAAKNSRSALARMAPETEMGRNIAKKTALALGDGVLAFYAPRSIRSVAVRWQNQLNENAKTVAFSGEIPEMDHNQLVGWVQGEKCLSCRPVFLLPSSMEQTVEKMTLVTIQLLSEAGLDPMVVPLHGNCLAENLLSGIILGDHVSFYRAIIKGLDPSPVPVIQKFKERIA